MLALIMPSVENEGEANQCFSSPKKKKKKKSYISYTGTPDRLYLLMISGVGLGAG